MPNTINNQPLFSSLQLTDYLAAWQGSQLPPTRKLTVAGLSAYYLSLTGGTVTGDVTFSAAKPKIKGNAGTVRAIQLLTGSTVRWQLDANATAESGTNAGSDFELWSYTDAGAQLTKVLAITRSSGLTALAGALTVGGTLGVTGASTLTGAATLSSTLAVTGSASFSSSVLTGGLNANPIGTSTNGTVLQANGQNAMYATSGGTLQLGNGAATPVTFFLAGSSTQVGSITNTVSSVSYNTSSDARLKLDDGLIAHSDASRIIDRLRPRWFRFKANPDADKQPGFFAQQVHRVFPWAVTKGHGRPGSKRFSPWQIDDGKFMPLVIAELQSLRRRVAALEAKAQ